MTITAFPISSVLSDSVGLYGSSQSGWSGGELISAETAKLMLALSPTDTPTFAGIQVGSLTHGIAFSSDLGSGRPLLRSSIHTTNSGISPHSTGATIYRNSLPYVDMSGAQTAVVRVANNRGYGWASTDNNALGTMSTVLMENAPGEVSVLGSDGTTLGTFHAAKMQNSTSGGRAEVEGFYGARIRSNYGYADISVGGSNRLDFNPGGQTAASLTNAGVFQVSVVSGPGDSLYLGGNSAFDAPVYTTKSGAGGLVLKEGRQVSFRDGTTKIRSDVDGEVGVYQADGTTLGNMNANTLNSTYWNNGAGVLLNTGNQFGGYRSSTTRRFCVDLFGSAGFRVQNDMGIGWSDMTSGLANAPTTQMREVTPGTVGVYEGDGTTLGTSQAKFEPYTHDGTAGLGTLGIQFEGKNSGWGHDTGGVMREFHEGQTTKYWISANTYYNRPVTFNSSAPATFSAGLTANSATISSSANAELNLLSSAGFGRSLQLYNTGTNSGLSSDNSSAQFNVGPIVGLNTMANNVYGCTIGSNESWRDPLRVESNIGSPLVTVSNAGTMTVTESINASTFDAGNDARITSIARTGSQRSPMQFEVGYNGGDPTLALELYRSQEGGTPPILRFPNSDGRIEGLTSLTASSLMVSSFAGMQAYSNWVPSLVGYQGARVKNSNSGTYPVIMDWAANSFTTTLDMDAPSAELGKLNVAQGTAAAGQASINNGNYDTFGINFHSNNKMQIGQWNNRVMGIGLTGSTLYTTVPSDGTIGFASSTAVAATSGTGDAHLRRVAAGEIGVYGADGTSLGTIHANDMNNSHGEIVQLDSAQQAVKFFTGNSLRAQVDYLGEFIAYKGITAATTLNWSGTTDQRLVDHEWQSYDSGSGLWQQGYSQEASASGIKCSVFGAPRVLQPAAIADADGSLSDVNAKLNLLLAAFRSFGGIAT